MKAVFVALVFHADGTLYFSSQAPEVRDDAKYWEDRGYVFRLVECFVPLT